MPFSDGEAASLSIPRNISHSFIGINHSVTWALDVCPALLNPAVPVAPTAPFHLLQLSLELSLEHLSSRCEMVDAPALWYLLKRKFKGIPLTLTHTTWGHGRGSLLLKPWRCIQASWRLGRLNVLLLSVFWSEIRGQLYSSCCSSLDIVF